jgi:hypothetical protein
MAPLLVEMPILPERSFLLTQSESKVYQYISKEKCTTTFYHRNGGEKFTVIGGIFLVGDILVGRIF